MTQPGEQQTTDPIENNYSLVYKPGWVHHRFVGEDDVIEEFYMKPKSQSNPPIACILCKKEFRKRTPELKSPEKGFVCPLCAVKQLTYARLELVDPGIVAAFKGTPFTLTQYKTEPLLRDYEWGKPPSFTINQFQFHTWVMAFGENHPSSPATTKRAYWMKLKRDTLLKEIIRMFDATYDGNGLLGIDPRYAKKFPDLSQLMDTPVISLLQCPTTGRPLAQPPFGYYLNYGITDHLQYPNKHFFRDDDMTNP